MCWNLDDDPVHTPLDDHPATGWEIGRSAVELTIACAVFWAAVGFVTAIAEFIR
jgi:hypothetical protein